MKIAVIGAGISGLTAAYLASEEHEVTVFEKEARIGGHTATVDIEVGGRSYAIDTGFIVFNDRTYPNFILLLQKLGVAFKKSSMGFSVSNARNGLEYAGNSLSTLFAQKRNLVSPPFLRMLSEIVRFNKTATRDATLGNIDIKITLEEYLDENRFSDGFRSNYLIPMGAAIWSASLSQVLSFPAAFFIEFFRNHGLLTITDKPQWYVIEGGSRTYLPPLTQRFQDKIEVNAEIDEIHRSENAVVLLMKEGGERVFDHVIFATHSDQALALLGDASDNEKDILGSIQYEENSVVLHRDKTLMPKNRKVWSSWNYLTGAAAESPPSLTYNMNILQGLNTDIDFLVTLNAEDRIDKDKIFGCFSYAHPQFSVEAYHAQKRKYQICGVNRTSYCGAYWSNGFHEDGVVSALDAVSKIGVDTKI